MNYDLHITLTAEKDITHAADYIEFVLKNPQAADHFLDETEMKISVLSQFPKQHLLVEDKILAAWGIRFAQIRNYLVFYIISEDDMKINIIRFFCTQSDWNSILNLGFSLI